MVSAIVLAAGLSTRMDKPKLSLIFKGQTLVYTVAKNILDSGIEEVIVVFGPDANEITNSLGSLKVTCILNGDFKKGITSSIQKGVSIANGDGYMICLADMPFIASEEYLKLTTAFEKQSQINNACICVGQYGNKRGNPVIFSSFYKKQIATHNNPEGCKDIIALNSQHVYLVEINSDSILKDIDTPDDYRRANL